VLFSDETSIELGTHGQVWVQRPIGDAMNPKYFTTKLPHPAKIHVWGCFSANGMGELEVFTETLDAAFMKRILSAKLLLSAQRLFGERSWWFLQDNDPKHSSRQVQQFLFANAVQCMDFPPYSPDLNPIENVWSDLKRRVEKRNARNIEELVEHVRQEWMATDVTFLSRLVASMPKRCSDVVMQQGNRTAH
jgi:transposase InsO family protein